jgi:hypothetical protein
MRLTKRTELIKPIRNVRPTPLVWRGEADFNYDKVNRNFDMTDKGNFFGGTLAEGKSC